MHAAVRTTDGKGTTTGAFRNKLLASLNAAFSATHFDFQLIGYDEVVNDRWAGCRNSDASDTSTGAEDFKKAKRHSDSTSEALNVYFCDVDTARGGKANGFAYVPPVVQWIPYLDGVVLHNPDFSATRFPEEAMELAIVHETGHWLGLLHTWHNGCAETPLQSPSASVDR